MKLQYNCEVVGVLRDIKRKNEETILTFEICKEIEVPFYFDFDKYISKFIGKKIGIFLQDGAIKVREI